MREQNFRSIQLGGSTQQEVGEFVNVSARVALPGDALETVHRRTEGNPLYVTEVVGSLTPAQMIETG